MNDAKEIQACKPLVDGLVQLHASCDMRIHKTLLVSLSIFNRKLFPTRVPKEKSVQDGKQGIKQAS